MSELPDTFGAWVFRGFAISIGFMVSSAVIGALFAGLWFLVIAALIGGVAAAG
jgi:hypothetical protein